MDVDEIVRADSFGPPRQVETVDLSLALYTLGAALERAMMERGNGGATERVALMKAAGDTQRAMLESVAGELRAGFAHLAAAIERQAAAIGQLATAVAEQKRPKVQVAVAPELRVPKTVKRVGRDLLGNVTHITEEPLPGGGGAA